MVILPHTFCQQAPKHVLAQEKPLSYALAGPSWGRRFIPNRFSHHVRKRFNTRAAASQVALETRRDAEGLTRLVSEKAAGEGSPFLWKRRWVPVSPVSYLDATRPLPVTLLGEPLVVWHHATHGWVVMRDVCPHRLAPLSEGRLEAGGTRLACAYHGWEFNETGACTRVPQLSGDVRAAATACASPRSCVTSFPTLLHDGLLLVWLDDSKEGLAEAAQAPPPRLLDERAVPAMSWSMNEVPNDYSFWVEQGVDPSHANFLHHGQMGFVEDQHLPMFGRQVETVDVSSGFKWQHGAYEKKLTGMKAQREFVAPFNVRWYHALPSGSTIYYCTAVVPVRPGVSRIYFKLGFGPGPKDETESEPCIRGQDKDPAESSASHSSAPSAADAAPAALSKSTASSGAKKSKSSSPLAGIMAGLQRKLPHWVHEDGYGGDQDVVMMSGQEVLMRRQGISRADYYLNSPADTGVVAMNTWLSKVEYPSSLWGQRPADAFPAQTYQGWPAQELPLEQMLSRQERHVKHCAECQRGMKLVGAVCRALTVGAGLAGLVAAALAAVAALSPQGAAAAGGWGWIVGIAVVSAGLAAAAVKGWEFYESRFGSGANRWRRVNGFKKPGP